MHQVSYPRSADRPWWTVPALDLTPDQASHTARRLVADGAAFNPYQTRFLHVLANNRRRLSPYRRRVIAMLMALSRQGGWKGGR